MLKREREREREREIERERERSRGTCPFLSHAWIVMSRIDINYQFDQTWWRYTRRYCERIAWVREYRCGIHLSILSMPRSTFSRSSSLSHHCNSLLFLLPLWNSQDVREGVNDPDGDFQGSADWNHRRDSSRLNSNCWGDRKKKSKKKRGRGRTGTSHGNPNVCYALSIRIPDSEMYIFQSVLLYTGNMTKEIVFE